MRSGGGRFNWDEDDDGTDERASLTRSSNKSRGKPTTNKRTTHGPSMLAPAEEYDRQARDIEELGGHVSAISEISGQISTMILESSRDLDELSDGMQRSQDTIAQLTARTEKMVQIAGGPRYCCVIMILSAIAFFLLLLLIYT